MTNAKTDNVKPDRRWIASLLGGLILLGVFADHALLHAYSQNAEPYHARVLATLDTIPVHVGEWIGTDEKLPQGAVSLLRPNATLSRVYSNLVTRQEANFLLVQCRDARDLDGHYPPICYAAHGYTLTTHFPMAVKIDDLELDGTMYEFDASRLSRRSGVKVFDVMILPDGKTAPNMDAVDRVARDRKQRYYGAAQIQILTDANMPDTDRDRVIKALLHGAKPMIEAIRDGVHDEP